MRTALDTNILSSLWSDEPSAPNIVAELGHARREGALVASAVVYAEALAHPRVTPEFINSFFATAGISIDDRFSKAIWAEAGMRFAGYSARRRMQAREAPRRILPDFLIGAHALVSGDRLMTLDFAFYRRNFPDLPLYPLAAQPL